MIRGAHMMKMLECFAPNKFPLKMLMMIDDDVPHVVFRITIVCCRTKYAAICWFIFDSVICSEPITLINRLAGSVGREVPNSDGLIVIYDFHLSKLHFKWIARVLRKCCWFFISNVMRFVWTILSAWINRSNRSSWFRANLLVLSESFCAANSASMSNFFHQLFKSIQLIRMTLPWLTSKSTICWNFFSSSNDAIKTKSKFVYF